MNQNNGVDPKDMKAERQNNGAYERPAWKKGVLLPMKYGKVAHCPYCGKFLNYFFLFDCKKSDIGTCNHCGGVFAVKYSFWAYLLFALSLAAFGCTFGYFYLANKSWPKSTVLLFFLGVFVILYFILPLFILPRKCIINNRLGGFPDKMKIPNQKTKHSFADGDPNAQSGSPTDLIVGIQDEVYESMKKGSSEEEETTESERAEVRIDAERLFEEPNSINAGDSRAQETVEKPETDQTERVGENSVQGGEEKPSEERPSEAASPKGTKVIQKLKKTIAVLIEALTDGLKRGFAVLREKIFGARTAVHTEKNEHLKNDAFHSDSLEVEYQLFEATPEKREEKEQSKKAPEDDQ